MFDQMNGFVKCFKKMMMTMMMMMMIVIIIITTAIIIIVIIITIIKRMYFKVSDNKLLKKYIQILKKVRHLLNITFDINPVYDDNDKDIATKIKICFHNKKIPKPKTPCKYLSLIMLIKKIKCIILKHLSSEECKYEIKRLKWKILLMMI